MSIFTCNGEFNNEDRGRAHDRPMWRDGRSWLAGEHRRERARYAKISKTHSGRAKADKVLKALDDAK